jgi:hypothetical protein
MIQVKLREKLVLLGSVSLHEGIKIVVHAQPCIPVSIHPGT